MVSYFLPHDDALHDPSRPVYGYSFSVHNPPFLAIYVKPSSCKPPWHPSGTAYVQSTNCCSLNSIISDPVHPFLIAANDSNEPTVENAQQLPQFPWSFTGVTYDVPLIFVYIS